MNCSIHTARLRIRRRLLGAVRVWPTMVFVKTDDVYRLAANPPKRGVNTGIAHRRRGEKERFRPMWDLPVVHPERMKKSAAAATTASAT